YLIGTRVRPSSTESWTGMSITMLMSPAMAAVLPAPPPWAPAAGAPTASKAGALSACGVAWACSSRAWAQSSIICASSCSVDIAISQPVEVCAAQAALDAQGVLAVVGAELALEKGNPVDVGLDQGLAVQLDEVAGLHGQQLLDGDVGLGQLGHHGHLGGLDLVAEQLDPAPVDLDGV